MINHGREREHAGRPEVGGSWDGEGGREGGGEGTVGRTRSMSDSQVQAFAQSRSPKLHSNTQPPQHGNRRILHATSRDTLPPSACTACGH